MGEYADEAVDRMMFTGLFSPQRSRKQRRRDRQRARRSMRECQFCGKFPLFFHEYEKDRWMLAEWDETNRPTKHVCKMKGRFNAYHKS